MRVSDQNEIVIEVKELTKAFGSLPYMKILR